MTGLPIGEILALRWGRINFVTAALRVEEPCYEGYFGTPKTKASRREVPLSSTVVQALLAHRSRRVDVSPEALVFATREGTPLASDNLRKPDLRPACARVGLPFINWHALTNSARR